VQALLQASDADDAVVRALVAKGNPVLLRLRKEDHRQGEAKGQIAGRKEGEIAGQIQGLKLAIEDLCEAHGIALLPEHQARLSRSDLAQLQALREQLKAHKAWPALK